MDTFTRLLIAVALNFGGFALVVWLVWRLNAWAERRAESAKAMGEAHGDWPAPPDNFNHGRK